VKHYQRNPARHEAASIEEQGEVTHRFWSVPHADRVHVTTAIVERSWPAIVFSRTRHGAERLSKQLNKAGVRAAAIHGDRSQSQRERALEDFARGAVHVLVATDVAARGIHVDGVACVVQYDPPAVDKDYVHRSGRTGRAGEAGTVITLVTPEKEKDVRALQRDLRRREPIEAATIATAGQVLAATPPKPIDRGDELDGVSRRERARREPRDTVAGQARSGRKPHRKGGGPRADAPTGEVRPARNGAGKPVRNGQERADTPARSGRPGAKPGRRPAGAGAARQGRPAGGNARRRSR
jgi:superfamily II DNA/RNA helicase